MTNHEYYFDSNGNISPNGVIAFGDWLKLSYNSAISQDVWYEKVYIGIVPRRYTTRELFTLWLKDKAK